MSTFDRRAPPLSPGAVVFGPRANCTIEICPIQYSIYGFRPSLAANSAFIGLFGLAGLAHLYLGWRWRTWFFMACMLLGCVSAIIGYIGRIVMHGNPFSFAAFLLQMTCVTTAPLYFCAAIYVTLALTVDFLSPDLSRLRPQLFYWIFIPCDLFSLVIQAAGGSLSTSSRGKSQLGINLALIGLAFQVFTIVIFCGLLADYLWRYTRTCGHTQAFKKTFKLYLSCLIISVLLILVRSAYRLAELHEGYRGRLVRDEPLYIVFEGGFIVVSVYSLLVGHPGLILLNRTNDRVRNIEQDQKAMTGKHPSYIRTAADMHSFEMQQGYGSHRASRPR